MSKFSPLNTAIVYRRKSSLHLLAVSALYKLCSNNAIVNAVSKLVGYRYSSLPRLLMKKSVFLHFCSGESIDSFKDVANELKCAHNIRSIIDHSSEETQSLDGRDKNFDDKKNLISIASNLDGFSQHVWKERCVLFVPVKVSSLVCTKTLEEVTRVLNAVPDEVPASEVIPFMKQHHLELIDSFEIELDRLRRLCEFSKSLHMCILLDAEESHRQPAVDVAARELSRVMNPLGHLPTVFNTYQMYLQRGPQNLRRDLLSAQQLDYVFAAKVVRGAYRIAEARREAEDPQGRPILQPSKHATDVAYDAAVEMLLEYIATSPGRLTTCKELKLGNSEYSHAHGDSYEAGAAVVIATHNTASVERAVNHMERVGLAADHPGVHWAQIKGMADHLSVGLGEAGFNAHKLVIFGAFDQVLPWLWRRLHENQDIFGALQFDRKLMVQELKRRFMNGLWR